MKWNKFALKVPCGDEYILYNTLNGSIVKLKKSIFNSLLIVNGDKKIIKNLKALEFILPSSFDEDKRFMKSLLKEWNDCGFLTVHFVATTGCNFKCPYCYQSGIKAQAMTKEKVDDIIDFLNRYIVTNKIKESTLEITGGEPTINWELVKYFLNKVDMMYKKNNVLYKTHIVTNGYNLTKDKVNFISKFNWQRLQITLDGLPEYHNNRRMHKNGDPTFNKIVNNIEYILKNNKISKINLRINYDKSNISCIPKFLSYVKSRFGTEKISISLGLITKTVSSSDANSFIEENGIQEEDFTKNYLKLYKKAFIQGFELSDIFSLDGMCTAKLKHGFLIEPTENLIKCVSGVGRKEFVVGNIKSNTSTDNYLFPDLYLECLSKGCPYVPICHTGCRFDAFVKNGDKKKINCKRKILDKINAEILRINYGDD